MIVSNIEKTSSQAATNLCEPLELDPLCPSSCQISMIVNADTKLALDKIFSKLILENPLIVRSRRGRIVDNVCTVGVASLAILYSIPLLEFPAYTQWAQINPVVFRICQASGVFAFFIFHLTATRELLLPLDLSKPRCSSQMFYKGSVLIAAGLWSIGEIYTNIVVMENGDTSYALQIAGLGSTALIATAINYAQLIASLHFLKKGVRAMFQLVFCCNPRKVSDADLLKTLLINAAADFENTWEAYDKKTRHEWLNKCSNDEASLLAKIAIELKPPQRITREARIWFAISVIVRYACALPVGAARWLSFAFMAGVAGLDIACFHDMPVASRALFGFLGYSTPYNGTMPLFDNSTDSPLYNMTMHDTVSANHTIESECIWGSTLVGGIWALQFIISYIFWTHQAASLGIGQQVVDLGKQVSLVCHGNWRAIFEGSPESRSAPVLAAMVWVLQGIAGVGTASILYGIHNLLLEKSFLESAAGQFFQIITICAGMNIGLSMAKIAGYKAIRMWERFKDPLSSNEERRGINLVNRFVSIIKKAPVAGLRDLVTSLPAATAWKTAVELAGQKYAVEEEIWVLAPDCPEECAKYDDAGNYVA